MLQLFLAKCVQCLSPLNDLSFRIDTPLAKHRALQKSAHARDFLAFFPDSLEENTCWILQERVYAATCGSVVVLARMIGVCEAPFPALGDGISNECFQFVVKCTVDVAHQPVKCFVAVVRQPFGNMCFLSKHRTAFLVLVRQQMLSCHGSWRSKLGHEFLDRTKKWSVISVGCWSTDTYCCNGPIIHGMIDMIVSPPK